jgi:sec-independent protein translocase protein TatA
MPLGGAEIVILVLLLFLLFGVKRFPEMGRSLGRGMREFKDAISGGNGDEQPDEQPQRIDISTTDPPATARSSTEPREADRVQR